MDDLEKIIKYYSKKKILVIGCTGFIGGWTCLILKKFSVNVYGIGLSPPSSPNFFNSCKLSKEIKFTKIDITNQKKLEKHLQKIKPEIIIHLAAQPIVLDGIKKPYQTFKTNFYGTLNILEACSKVNSIKNLTIYTTDKVYFNDDKKHYLSEKDIVFGDDPYSASKSSSEHLIKSYSKNIFKNKIKVLVIRAGNIIGGGDWANYRIIPDIIRAWRTKSKLVVRNQNSIRPWQYVVDVVFKTLYLLYKTKKNYDVFNISPIKKNHVNISFLVKNFKRYFSFTFKEKKEIKSTIIEKKNLILNSKKLRKIVKSKEYPISNIFFKTAEWYKQFYNNSDAKNISENQIKEYLESYENNQNKF
jgi:CDP-glucose 4,6-dehydratase